jgi:cytochrome P450/NADPH-cytochrome P450 reductase
MIMVGPGTGVAPFRGFLQERLALQRRGVPVGEALLFFGCRDPEQDLLYGDELRAMEAAGVVRLHVAHSRVPGQPKVYVQQRIVEQGPEVWRLLQQGAVVFVCGDATRMAPDVRAALAAVAGAQGGMPAESAADWFAELRQAGRYLEDVWGGGGA